MRRWLRRLGRRVDLRARVLVLLVSLALVAMALSVLVGGDGDEPPLKATPTAGCDDVLLLLVAGNAEGTDTTPMNPGATLGRFKDYFVAYANANKRSVEVRQIDYRTVNHLALATSRNDLPANRMITAAHVARWNTGRDAAVTATIHTLIGREIGCPQQDIVLAGFAQGAGVVHRALAWFPASSTVTQRVVGTTLISDPDRAPGTRASLLGTPLAGGSAIGVERARGSAVADVPKPGTWGLTYSVCASGDLVCDFRNQSVIAGLITHTQAYTGTNARWVSRAAIFLAYRTREFPRPRPLTANVTGAMNEPLRHEIAVDVNPAHRANLRFQPVGALPPGLSLSSSGVLAGTPTTPGSWSVPYTVSNTVHPAYSRPVRGTLNLSIEGGGAVSSVGGDSSCTVRATRDLYCWGDNYDGQLGIGNITNQTRPVRTGDSGAYTSVSVGASHTCAIRTTKVLQCWGLNNYGQVGDNSRTSRLRPVTVGAHYRWVSVSASMFHTCGITTTGIAMCWGKGDEGSLGNGSTMIKLVPTQVGASNDWSTISAGIFHTCGTLTNGSLWCFGSNEFGQLGDRTNYRRLEPVRTAASGYVSVSASAMNTCALTTTGVIRCWGANSSGQLGNGTRNNSNAPVTVAGSDTWIDVAMGDRFACGVTKDGVAKCWGTGTTGQLGRPGVAGSNTPVPVYTGARWRSLGGGWGHVCAIQNDGATACWGFNTAGQIGDGTHSTRFGPVRILSS